MTNTNTDFYYAPRSYQFKDPEALAEPTPKPTTTTTNVPHQPVGNIQSATNVDLGEIQKFTALAHEWWDKNGAFATLHQINPLRLNWIEQQVIAHQKDGLTGKRVLDVGCGGGILSHSMAKRGATVTGLDLGKKNIERRKFMPNSPHKPILTLNALRSKTMPRLMPKNLMW